MKQLEEEGEEVKDKELREAVWKEIEKRYPDNSNNVISFREGIDITIQKTRQVEQKKWKKLKEEISKRLEIPPINKKEENHDIIYHAILNTMKRLEEEGE